MQITSNDNIQLEVFYNELKRDRVDVSLKKKQVKDAMGFDLIMNVDIDVAKIVGLLLAYKVGTLYLKTKEKKEEITDIEMLKDETKIDNESQLYIEYKKR